MKEIFDLKRFCKYFAYDIDNARNRYGLSLLILGGTPLILLVLKLFFSALGWGNALEDSETYTYLPVLVACIVCWSFGAKAYGNITDRKAGTDWITVPSSALEKTLSMLLITCVVVPAALLAVMAASHFVVSLIVPSVAHVMPFFSFVSEGLNDLDASMFFNAPLVIWLSWCENILIFTLGAIIFKRNKVGKTFLAIMLIGIVISLLMMLAFHTVSLGSDDLERLVGDVTPERFQTFVNVTLNILYGVVFAALVAGLYFRIKTIKA